MLICMYLFHSFDEHTYGGLFEPMANVYKTLIGW